MPSLIIDTRKPGDDKNKTPHVEIFYSKKIPVSLIQKTVGRNIKNYNVVFYPASKSPDKIQSRSIKTIPTTIALENEYEIERWEILTHADDIQEVLDAW
jgi:hypothetical protein